MTIRDIAGVIHILMALLTHSIFLISLNSFSICNSIKYLNVSKLMPKLLPDYLVELSIIQCGCSRLPDDSISHSTYVDSLPMPIPLDNQYLLIIQFHLCFSLSDYTDDPSVKLSIILANLLEIQLMSCLAS